MEFIWLYMTAWYDVTSINKPIMTTSSALSRTTTTWMWKSLQQVLLSENHRDCLAPPSNSPPPDPVEEVRVRKRLMLSSEHCPRPQQQLGCGRVYSRFYCQRTWLHLAIVPHLTQLRSWWWGRGWCCPSYIIVGLLSTLSHRHYSATTWAYTNVRPTDKSATKCGRGWTTYSSYKYTWA